MVPKDRIPFSKLSASANDFIVIDNREGSFSSSASNLARRACARRYSVGADGLILIEKSQQAAVRVRYFNPDGQEFSTCGNGGRCAARYVHLFIIPEDNFTMETNVGMIDAQITGNQVKIKFVGPTDIHLHFSITLDGKRYTGHVVHLGDPHFVVYSEQIPGLDFVPLARRIRYHEAFAPEGTNVHFIELQSRSAIRIRTYERGVEDETLACGSGCISAAVSTFRDGQTEPPVFFEPQSGIPVKVHFKPENHFQDLYLEGDARLIYQGEFTPEALSGFPIPGE